MTQPPVAALVGISGYGKIYYERLLHHAAAGEVRIAAATVINQAEEAAACVRLRQHGCQLYDDYRKMLEDYRGRLDLVLIPTGIPWHMAMTVAALEAGANVLVEKPLTATVAELDAIRDASRRMGRFVAVGFQFCYHPALARVHTLVAGGAIGDLQSVRCIGLWPRPEAYYRRNRWAGCITAAGSTVWDSPMTNALAHFLLLVLQWALIGRERQESLTIIEAELYRAQAIESYDTVAFRAATTGGAHVMFLASHSTPEVHEPEIVLAGTHGRIRCDFLTRTCVCTRPGQPDESFALPDDDALRARMFVQVLQRVRDPAASVCTLELAALHTRCIAAIHDHAVIHDIPAGLRQPVRDAGETSPRICVPGLGEVLLRAFAGQRLPGEQVPAPAWSRPATRFAFPPPDPTPASSG